MQKPHILIVEDSSSISSELEKRIRADLGFQVTVASDFSSARKIIDVNPSKFFLAILDLVLPDAQNGEVVDFAVQRCVPSIVFTSSMKRETRERILSKNVIDYVVKNDQAINNLIRFVGRLHKNRAVKVMVVDDSASIRKYMMSLLRLYMFQVFEAENGETALDVLKKNPDISLMVTDFEMPGINGVELTAKARTSHGQEDLAIIGVSSLDKEPLSVRFIKNGANDFLMKPFEKEEFFCRVMHNVENVENLRSLRELGELKDRFLGMAAHDLRNPINGINGFARLLLEGAGGAVTSSQEEMLKVIVNASGQMNDLVNDLLDISVIESGNLELSLKKDTPEDVIDERLRLARITANDKDISIIKDFRNVPEISFDHKRVGQVVDNLVGNAVKYSPSGTTVAVSLRYHENDVVIGVQDQGPGIIPEEQGLLFNSFERTSNQPTAGETSTGLGLAIAKKIIEAHRGRIWVESEPGNGAAFFFALPMN